MKERIKNLINDPKSSTLHGIKLATGATINIGDYSNVTLTVEETRIRPEDMSEKDFYSESIEVLEARFEYILKQRLKAVQNIKENV